MKTIKIDLMEEEMKTLLKGNKKEIEVFDNENIKVILFNSDKLDLTNLIADEFNELNTDEKKNDFITDILNFIDVLKGEED